MMKGKPWTPAALREVGGTEGIGVTFLEEMFSVHTAPPEHRLHQKAARAVLKALLPESGADIKGNMRSSRELMDASGYSDRPKDFDELIRILDSEIRLITPTDPEASETADGPTDHSEVGRRYYQLTHDYLVTSLLNWLTRKQKETRRGRAEFRLADRVALWKAKPENRLLPSLWEYLNIRLLTDRKKWTASQQKMMRKAGRLHGIRFALVGMAIVAVIAAGFAMSARFQDRENQNYASALVQSLLAANTADVTDLIGEIDRYHQWTKPLLRKVVDGNETTRKQKLHATLALLKDDPSQVDFVLAQLLDAQVDEVPVIITLLKPYEDHVEPRLWKTVRIGTSSERLRAAAAVAAHDSENPEWRSVSSDVVTALVSVTPTELKPWIVMLRPVGTQLVGPLEACYRDRTTARNSDRALMAATLADYLKDKPKKLTELIFLADNDREFLPFLEALRPYRGACVDEFRPFLGQTPPADAKPDIRDAYWKKQANAAACLLGLGEPQAVWPLLKQSQNPSLRSFIIDRLARLGTDHRILSDRLEKESEPSVRQALILALGEFDAGKLSEQERQTLVNKLSAFYRNDPDPGVHSAAGWTIKQYEAVETVARLDAELQGAELPKAATKDSGAPRRWLMNSQGQTFTLVDFPVPVDFRLGDKRGPSKAAVAYRFAIATREVTVAQFKNFCGYVPARARAYPLDCPAIRISWYGAAAYCNWLSQQEGIPKEEWCYERNEKGDYGAGMKISANFLRRTGYRLPTETEWEYVCQANAHTSFSFGEPVELLKRYAWYVDDSHSRTWPVGSLRPNFLGVFDMHGNAWEWCQDAYAQKGKKASGESETIKSDLSRVLLGGSFDQRPEDVRAGQGTADTPNAPRFNQGFRLVRTYR